MARNSNSKRTNNSSIQNVRVVDPIAGGDGAKMDRQLAHMQNTADHIQVLVSDSFAIDTTVDARNGTFDWRSIRQFDDFLSMAAQFNTYRIRSIRFDIYDVNPSLTAVAYWSTYHDQYNAANPPAFTVVDVIDGIDSQIVPPGTGKIQLTWMAHTLNERGYYDVNASSPQDAHDFGGLRYSQVGIGSVATKYRVSIKAFVDFRGRR